jgi:hypothetical protein
MTPRRRFLLGVALLVAAVALYFFSRPSAPPPPVLPSAEETPTAPSQPPPIGMPDLAPPAPDSSQAGPPTTQPLPPPQPPPKVGPKPISLQLDSGAFERQTDGTYFKKYDIERTKQLHQPGESPDQDLGVVSNLIDSYRKIFRENPIAGENWEVVDALTGNNEYDLVFIDPAHPAINENGELTDRWGTPYRFHPISSTEPLEISSAGPDLVFGTIDDIMLEEPRIIGDQGVE